MENMPLADLGRVKIYYEEKGEGKPLFLLPGFSSDVAWWHQTASSLQSSFRMVLVEYRGGGRGVHPGAFTLEDLAKDVVEVMDLLKMDKVALVGHSMGGAVAQKIAAFFPERISHLGLLCSFSHLRETALFFLQTSLKMREAKVPLDLVIETTLPWGFSSGFLRHPHQIETFKQFLLSNPHPPPWEGLQHRYQVLKAFDSRPFLHQIRAKTLILTTDRDFFVPFSDTEKLSEGIAGSKLLSIAAEGHNVLLEAPERVAQELRKFL